MIIADCSQCANVQCLNQVSNASLNGLTQGDSPHLVTAYTCEPSIVMSTPPVCIPSEYAAFPSITVLVESQLQCATLTGLYTCVECTSCMEDCKHWDFDNICDVRNICCYMRGPLGCCGGRYVISIANIEPSYAGTCIYAATWVGCFACDLSRTIKLSFLPGV